MELKIFCDENNIFFEDWCFVQGGVAIYIVKFKRNKDDKNWIETGVALDDIIEDKDEQIEAGRYKFYRMEARNMRIYTPFEIVRLNAETASEDDIIKSAKVNKGEAKKLSELLLIVRNFKNSVSAGIG